MIQDIFSRPVRLGALVSGQSESFAANLLMEKKILVRIESSFCDDSDGREAFLFAVNQALRFCPNVSICIEGHSDDLIRVCDRLATEIYGQETPLKVVDSIECGKFDALINVGTQVFAGFPSATINSSGWVARLATASSGTSTVCWQPEKPNPLGALAAACLGVGAAFLAIFGPALHSLTEISLFTHEAGSPGTLTVGPPLPESGLEIDAFLVGCGAVTNGWAYAVKRLPIVGKLQAIDAQSLRMENLGAYVAAGRDSVSGMRAKALLIKELLWPAIDVVERPDHWEFFKIRLRNELVVPPLVVAGLDNVTTRHSVQRLWPETLIDMAAGELQSQVIVKHKRGDGQCLLEALAVHPNETPWAESLARKTGLSAERITNDPTGEITQAEIDAAPQNKRLELQGSLGKPRCGHINQQTLKLEGYDPDFAPAVPFVTAFSGVIGAAETVKFLMGHRYPHSLHFQRSFLSGHSRALDMKCDPGCECQCTADRLEPPHPLQTRGSTQMETAR
jgi:hypothetical protein